MTESSSTPTNKPSPAEPQVNSVAQKKPLHHHHWVQVLLVVLLLIVAGGVGYYVWGQPRHVPAPTPVPKAAVRDATWLAKPVTIPDPGVFTNLKEFYQADQESQIPDVTYSKVGTFYGEDIILVHAPPPGLGTNLLALLIKTGPSSFSLIKKHATELYDDHDMYIGPKFSSKTTLDPNIDFPSITYQKTLSIKNVQIASSAKNYNLFSDFSATSNTPVPTQFATTKYGPVFQYTIGTGDGFTVQQFVLKMPDQEALTYQLSPPFISENEKVPQVTWSNGTKATDSYRFDGTGSCGTSSGLAVLANATGAGLAEAGKTNEGEVVYSFATSTDPTLKYFYKQYTDNFQGQVDASGKPISILTLSQFIAKHSVFVYKDALGRYDVLANSDYVSVGGCGKPVIYLYPTKATQVSVSVDAKITKSDPFYGTGWTVLAQPNGDLLNGGKHYDSLFWEGFSSHSLTIPNSGFAVSQSQLLPTLDSQLHQLGLTDKEANDFKAFWVPRLPKTPYVRLTWLGTTQMNQLAPLHISPAPSTLIRIFLEFQGLQQPASITPEHLSSIPRRGFTVVEWGGELGSR